jgi:hypothetical protein
MPESELPLPLPMAGAWQYLVTWRDARYLPSSPQSRLVFLHSYFVPGRTGCLELRARHWCGSGEPRLPVAKQARVEETRRLAMSGSAYVRYVMVSLDMMFLVAMCRCCHNHRPTVVASDSGPRPPHPKSYVSARGPTELAVASCTPAPSPPFSLSSTKL